MPLYQAGAAGEFGSTGDAVDNTVQAHALDVAEQLQTAGPILRQAVQDGKLQVIAARYDLDSGKVSLLPAARKQPIMRRILPVGGGSN